MLSLQEMSDRFEIQQLMVDYAHAIDQKNYDGLDRVFTPDAFIDYRAMGGIHGPYPEIKKWLKEALDKFPRYFHMLGNISPVISGDTARARTICFNPMVMDLPQKKGHVMFLGLWYIDKFIRTPQGWRMSERVEEQCFHHNLPGAVQFPNS